MSNPVFLIDLASARPPTPQPANQWPAIAREHAKQLIRCIRRILAHSAAKSVTTHVFDSTRLTHAGRPSTKPLGDALQDLIHLPDQVARLDTTEVSHPTAHGVHAGISDGAPEDNFADFYTESKSTHEVFVFARAPANRPALAAFITSKDAALHALEASLAQSPFLPKKLRELAKRGDRLIWVNSTPRRCERVGDVDHEVEQVFSKWLLSFSSQFRFVSLHSFLLDRRIIPARAIVKSLWDDSADDDLRLGKRVEVLCLQDSQLLRCFSANMNALQGPAGKSKTSRISLLPSGLVRNYGTEELTKFGAFDSQARVLSPASNPSRDDTRPPCSSIFAGLMVDLARQNMCLIADFFEVDEADKSFTRYQTLLQPITPLLAALRKLSRTELCVNYDNSCLPHTFDEWMSWDKLEHVEDCDIADSAIDASAKFFETYLPSLFSPERKEDMGKQEAVAAKHASRKLGASQEDNMLLSFEGSSAFLRDSGHQALAAIVKGVEASSKPLKDDRGTETKGPDRDLIIKRLQAQQDAEQQKKQQISPKSTPEKQFHTPQKSERRKGHGISPKSGGKFKWSRRSKVVAPCENDIQTCIAVHASSKKRNANPDATCKKKEKVAESASQAPATVVRSEQTIQARASSSTPENSRKNSEKAAERVYEAPKTVAGSEHIQAGISPTTPKDSRDAFLLADGKAKSNLVTTISRGVAADADGVQHNVESENRSPESVNISGLTLNEQPERPIIGHEGISHLGITISGQNKRKAEVLGYQEVQSRKQQSLNLLFRKEGEEVKSECERYHGNAIRGTTEAFSTCAKELSKEDSRAIEGVAWKCVAHLASLAKVLAAGHDSDCDLDRIINLNLKMPKAVTRAVQLVQDKVKKEDISPNLVLREMWETIISAFEQTVWHLACTRRTATNRPEKKGIDREVRKVATILSCTQFMAEMAANNRRQPVSFRNLFSKLFSSVFVHLAHKDSGEPIPAILSLFEEFEEPIPASLKASNGPGERNDGLNEYPLKPPPLTGGALSQSQSLLFGSNTGTTTATASKQARLSDKLSSKVTKTRSRPANKAPSRIVADARSKTQKITLGRAQFAKESEALRIAVKSQNRLPFQSAKLSNRKKRRSEEARKRISKDAPDGATLQEILASTVPAPMIDDLSADELEDTVDQTPPPATKREKNGKVLATCATPGLKESGSEDIADAGEGKTGSSPRQDEKNMCEPKSPSAIKKGKQETLEGAQCDNVSPRSDSDKPSAISGIVTRRQAKEVVTGQKHVEERRLLNQVHSTPGSTGEMKRNAADQVETKQGLKEKRGRNENRSSSRSLRRVTRCQAKQVLVEKTKEQASVDASPGSSHRVTRSQARQKAPKRKLKERSLGASGRKRRRQKELSAHAKLGSEETNTRDSQASPKSSSPVTRSQAKALETKVSLQLRNRYVNRPRRLAVKQETRDVVADTETAPMKDVIDVPKTPDLRPCTNTGDVLSPETPLALGTSALENTQLCRIVSTSLEKRKEQLEQEDFIPETPVAPKSSEIIAPSRRPVSRTLIF